jgi:hypothetical protein
MLLLLLLRWHLYVSCLLLSLAVLPAVPLYFAALHTCDLCMRAQPCGCLCLLVLECGFL